MTDENERVTAAELYVYALRSMWEHGCEYKNTGRELVGMDGNAS